MLSCMKILINVDDLCTSVELNDFHLFSGAVHVDYGVQRSFLVWNVSRARALVFAVDDEMHFRSVRVVGRRHEEYTDARPRFGGKQLVGKTGRPEHEHRHGSSGSSDKMGTTGERG